MSCNAARGGPCSDDAILQAIETIAERLIADLVGHEDEHADAGDVRLSLPKSASAGRWRTFTQQLILLAKVQLLVRDKRRCALRDLYYQVKQTGLFPKGAQDVSTASVRISELIARATAQPSVPRSALGIICAPKGLVAGPLLLKTDDDVSIDTSREPWTIIGDVDAVCRLQVSGRCARFFLVVEKHTCFQQLVDAGFHTHHGTVICTGRGFPDLATRAFVRLVTDRLGLRPLLLTDWNPSGIHIFLTFRQASSGAARTEGDRVTVPEMRWLGLHHDDVSSLPRECFDVLSDRDESSIEGILSRLGHDVQDTVVRECHAMKDAGTKVDIDHVGRSAETSTQAVHPGVGGLVSLLLRKMLSHSH